MKVFSKPLWLAFALPLIWACGEMEQPPIIQQTPATLTSPAAGTNIILNQEEGDENLIFEVSQAEFALPGDITYTLQMDKAGNNFGSPTDIASSSTRTIEVPIRELNTKALAEGLEVGVAGNVEIRVSSTTNRNLRPIISAPIPMTITPYSAAVDFPMMYVPGDYQGWNPENEKTVIYSINRDNVFEGYVHILSGSGEFKVNETPSWDINYGSGGGNTLVADGDNLKVSEFGTFKLKIDLNEKTYEFGEKLKWSIIGEAVGGWNASDDVPFGFDRDNNVLKVTTDMAAGEYKFRANKDWIHNLGAVDGGDELEQDGPNMVIEEAGNYTVILDFSVPGVTSYSVTKN